jgi:hypothetical protein
VHIPDKLAPQVGRSLTVAERISGRMSARMWPDRGHR